MGLNGHLDSGNKEMYTGLSEGLIFALKILIEQRKIKNVKRRPYINCITFI